MQNFIQFTDSYQIFFHACWVYQENNPGDNLSSLPLFNSKDQKKGGFTIQEVGTIELPLWIHSCTHWKLTYWFHSNEVEKRDNLVSLEIPMSEYY